MGKSLIGKKPYWGKAWLGGKSFPSRPSSNLYPQVSCVWNTSSTATLMISTAHHGVHLRRCVRGRPVEAVAVRQHTATVRVRPFEPIDPLEHHIEALTILKSGAMPLLVFSLNCLLLRILFRSPTVSSAATTTTCMSASIQRWPTRRIYTSCGDNAGESKILGEPTLGKALLANVTFGEGSVTKRLAMSLG